LTSKALRNGAAVLMLLMENVAMTTFDLTPLYRSTVGYEPLFETLRDSIRPDWPPYDIEKTDEDEYCIKMAVAGFGPDEIELTQHGAALLVSGHKASNGGQRQMLHHGLAFRDFRQSFNLADHVKVTGATLENGLLAINLIREVPEALKPRKITIGAGAKSDPKQIDSGKDHPKAA
jgi:molecular chaperone IbpA